MQHALQGGEALRQLIGRADLIHTGQILQLLSGLLHLGIVFQSDHVAVTQILRLNAAEGAVVVMVADEVLKRFLPGNVFRVKHIVQKVDLRADGSCLGVGKVAVDVHHNFAGLIQILNHDVQIVSQRGEAAHDDQTRHRDADSSKGHEAVLENAAEALLEQVPDIIELHVCFPPRFHLSPRRPH